MNRSDQTKAQAGPHNPGENRAWNHMCMNDIRPKVSQCAPQGQCCAPQGNRTPSFLVDLEMPDAMMGQEAQ
jgi:hypothetical protein